MGVEEEVMSGEFRGIWFQLLWPSNDNRIIHLSFLAKEAVYE